MNEPKMALQAGELIGFKQALQAFSGAAAKFGGSDGQICFLMYPDGTIGPKLNGRIDPHQLLAALKFLAQIADEQVAAMAAEMRDMKRGINGASAPLILKPQ